MTFNEDDLELLKEWVVKDLFVELYHTRPVTKNKNQEDGSIVQEAEVGSDGHPILKETLIGVSYLSLKDLGHALRAILATRKV